MALSPLTVSWKALYIGSVAPYFWHRERLKRKKYIPYNVCQKHKVVVIDILGLMYIMNLLLRA